MEEQAEEAIEAIRIAWREVVVCADAIDEGRGAADQEGRDKCLVYDGRS